jgi:hypothetical protein
MMLYTITLSAKNLVRVWYNKSTDFLSPQQDEVDVSTNSNLRIMYCVLASVGNIGLVQYIMISLTDLSSKWTESNLQDALSFAHRKENIEGHDCKRDNCCSQLGRDRNVVHWLWELKPEFTFLWAENKLVCLEIHPLYIMSCVWSRFTS